MRASTPAHWDRWWTEHREVEETYSNEDRLLSQVRDLSLGGAYVLEVGAGSGRDSLEIARRGGRIVLVDYVMSSFEVIRRQSQAAGLPVHCVCADGTQMPFRERQFDLVFHQGLLEHFRDPSPLVAENYRVTRPGGHCLIDVPQRFHVYTVVKQVLILMGRWFAGWETQFSPGELIAVMTAAGYRNPRVGGDWMVPGFFYRSLRYALRKVGIKLPQYPREIPVLALLARRWRRWFRGTRLGPSTFAMVNVLAERPGGSGAGGPDAGA